VDKFLASYIETALWSSVDEAGTPLDNAKYADAELADETIKRFAEDCAKFESEATAILNAHDYVLGDFHVAHDFWLTRNGDGAGFWDDDYPEPIGTLLTDLAHSYGECNLYVGDDGKIYC